LERSIAAPRQACAEEIRLTAQRPKVPEIQLLAWGVPYKPVDDNGRGRFRSLREEAESGAWSAPSTIRAGSDLPSDETVRRMQAYAAYAERQRQQQGKISHFDQLATLRHGTIS
jgi:hypothetical protein